ncbi:hypothetical protein L2106_21680 [Citrobacter portucalensis]|uniref:DUF4760 domain-containing protein n=1 Tax=Citrobacter portucalensis TaxID=1639133 RepID=A0ABZ0H1R7_9ENTR|nr:hypothetical protein [Citrobacter portucalensis]MDE9576002.1 hypothetical protein [Citrobacter portucalensis]MDE9650785.1 hypothetical protein [Citrobacter portucalensis]WOH44237.1 hypothetical protein RY846_03320 [Citrobacter portucalensis]
MKLKNNLNIILTVCVLLLLVSIGSYVLKFHDMPFSRKTSDWSNFGSYIAGTVGPLLSLISILFILKSINSNNENHNALMEFTIQDKIHNQIKDLSTSLKEAIANHYIFEKPEKPNHQPYGNLICSRISQRMPFRGELTVEEIAIEAIRESFKDFQSELSLILKIIALLEKLNPNDREIYKLMIEVKLTNEERAVLYCFACKYFPSKANAIQTAWPNFRGSYFRPQA